MKQPIKYLRHVPKLFVEILGAIKENMKRYKQVQNPIKILIDIIYMIHKLYYITLCVIFFLSHDGKKHIEKIHFSVNSITT